MSVTPPSNENPSRFLRPEVAADTAKHLESALQGARRASGPDSASIDEKVKKSLSSIERLVENYTALQNSVDRLKEGLERTAYELNSEKEVNAHLDKMLEKEKTKASELEASLASEQLRRREFQTTIATLELMLSKLEDENSTARAQALKLVQGVEVLMAAENNVRLKRMSLAARLAQPDPMNRPNIMDTRGSQPPAVHP